MTWSWLGRVGYAEGLALQAEAVRRRQSGLAADHLFLLEHPHVFTVGRRGREADVLWDAAERRRRGVELHFVDRGGEVTYHGPGQLVGYPVVDVGARGHDLHAYLRDLEAVIIEALRPWGVVGRRRPGLTGVWVEPGPSKIAAIGVHAARWVTSHGFALNLAPDLGYFAGIVPCGQRDARVTSVLRETGLAPELPVAAAAVGALFQACFESPPNLALPFAHK